MPTSTARSSPSWRSCDGLLIRRSTRVRSCSGEERTKTRSSRVSWSNRSCGSWGRKMSSPLDRLKDLTPEAPDAKEFERLKNAAAVRLPAARNAQNSLETRFDAAYHAAHFYCLAALRYHGYRAKKRYIVFQVLPHTLGLGPEVWRVLAKCHQQRNLAEYQGELDVDERLLLDLLSACDAVRVKVEALAPLP